MQAKRQYRDRDTTEVAVLDALVDRREEGMTVFELRSRVDADIDDLEESLSALKSDGLITAESNGEETLIRPADRVVAEDVTAPDGGEESVIAWLRRKLGL
ncbi:DUF6432 family protein [Halocalculus aciditolerans]|nr:DUF6432 family protein [Halocalculus aciditolerans]